MVVKMILQRVKNPSLMAHDSPEQAATSLGLCLAPEAWIPDAYIIEELLRQEREREQARQRPFLELPLPQAPWQEAPTSQVPPPPPSRVIIMEI